MSTARQLTLSAHLTLFIRWAWTAPSLGESYSQTSVQWTNLCYCVMPDISFCSSPLTDWNVIVLFICFQMYFSWWMENRNLWSLYVIPGLMKAHSEIETVKLKHESYKICRLRSMTGIFESFSDLNISFKSSSDHIWPVTSSCRLVLLLSEYLWWLLISYSSQ